MTRLEERVSKIERRAGVPVPPGPVAEWTEADRLRVVEALTNSPHGNAVPHGLGIEDIDLLIEWVEAKIKEAGGCTE